MKIEGRRAGHWIITTRLAFLAMLCFAERHHSETNVQIFQLGHYNWERLAGVMFLHADWRDSFVHYCETE